MAQFTSQLAGRVWSWLAQHKQGVVLVVVWGVIIILIQQYIHEEGISLPTLVDRLGPQLSQSALGPLIYMGLYILRPLLLFPAWVLTVVGGNTFGVFPGLVYALIGGTASAIIPYALGRGLPVNAPDTANRNSRFHRFLNMLHRNPFQAILIMRLLYLPYDGVNLLAGSLRIPAVAFIAATALGNIGGTLSFIGIGASIDGDFSSGNLSISPRSVALSVVILVASLALSRVLNRSHRLEPSQTIGRSENE